MSDDRHLDGNALAGLLSDAFGSEMTQAQRHCPGCGSLNALGAHRAYISAGAVLRCPGCGQLAVRIAILPDRHIIELTGAWKLAVPRH
jgi:Family of unknown function (DUF6510)